MKIAVTGVGIISSIGLNTDQNLHSLRKGESGIVPIKGLGQLRKPFLGGQVSKSDLELKKMLGYLEDQSIHRSTMLGLMAAKEAWGERVASKDIKNAVLFGTTIGGINLTDQILNLSSADKSFGKVDYRLQYDANFGTQFIADELGITGYVGTISTACSSAANSILVGARLIKHHLADRILVGGAESITDYILNGFDSLMLYDDEPCRPFDANRKGLNLGEAGCFIVLESEELAIRSNSNILCYLSGWSNVCDAYHQTASSPDGIGATLAMQQALAMAELSPSEINYLNAHGTGTPNNDLSESNAIEKVFGANPPAFSSTKAYTGHTLAAAGGVEAIYSILSLQHQLVYPNLRYETAMPEVKVKPVTTLTDNMEIQHVLSNSFGFGGNCTTLIFSS